MPPFSRSRFLKTGLWGGGTLALAALFLAAASFIWEGPACSPTGPCARTDGQIQALADWAAKNVVNLDWSPRRGGGDRLSRELLGKSLDLGRSYLIANQRPEGNFQYEYDFVARKFTRGDNQVRQAGALWGLALLFRHFQDAETRAALDRGLGFFFRHSQEGGATGSLVVAYPGAARVETGTVALLALAIIEYLRVAQERPDQIEESRREELHQHLNGYLAHINAMRLDDDHFADGYSLNEQRRNDTSNPYADGEVLLAMVKAAKYLGHEQLIPLAERSAIAMAARYTLDAWEKDPDSAQTKGFYQWGSMAFWEYQDAGWVNGELLGDYVLTLAWWMIQVHHTLERPRNTAYAQEGIIHAYRLAKDRGISTAADDLRQTIDEAMHKLTSWQVGGPLRVLNGFLRQHPSSDPLAVGGVMNEAADPLLRIDVTQHQMHAVLLALEHVYPDSTAR